MADIFTPSSIVDYVQSGGIIGILIFIIIGGARRWWVFGWQYKELQQRYDKLEQANSTWRELASRGINVTERVVGMGTQDAANT